MLTIIDNFRSTYDLDTEQIELDVLSDIAYYDSQTARLLKIMTNLSKKSAHDRVVRWFEDELLPVWTTVAATATTGQLTVVVQTGHGKYFRIGSVVKHLASGEILLVTAISTDTLTITRDYSGDVTEGQLLPNESLLIYSSSFKEGADAPDPKTTQAVEKTNPLQIIRNSGGVTKTELNIATYTEDDMKYQMRKTGEEHARDIEFMLLHGKAKTQTTNIERLAKGLLEFPTTNVVTQAGATLAESDVLALGEKVGRYGSDEKWLVGGLNFIRAVTKLAGVNLRVSPDTKKYGIRINEWDVGNCLFKIMRHPMLEANPTASALAHANDLDRVALCLDMDFAMYRYLNNRDTKMSMNIQAPKADAVQWEYLTEACAMVRLEKTCGKLKAKSSTEPFA